ncbi:MAG: methionine--tRNA ligase [Candidatus Makana argininalis]
MKKKLITSSLPYINGIKHLGNLIGSILPADICARYFRQQQYDVLFICGTDEHGTPAEISAIKKKITINKFCEKYYILQKNIYKKFNISFDFFGRTSSLFHHKFVKSIFNTLDNNGFIFSKYIKQIYSIEEKRFLPDRYIEGKCPFCNFYNARGDQCDNCNSIFNINELIKPRSVINPFSTLKLLNSEHLFFNFKNIENKLKYWIKKNSYWSFITQRIAKKWISEKIKPRCITRDLIWGVKVPKLGFENKVFYVWFDAILGYISFTQEFAFKKHDDDLWKTWWKNKKNVDLIQFMAKDNIFFHSIFLPSIMIATKEKWTLPNIIKGLNWLTYEGKKFSTSLNRGIFTDKALNFFPSDYWRYTLFCMIPESSDSDFSFNLMSNIVNNLSNSLGNFVNRLTSIIIYNYNGILSYGYIPDNKLINIIIKYIYKYDYYMHKLEYRKSGTIMIKMWQIGNEYFTKKKPWLKKNIYLIKYHNILKNCLWLIFVYSCLLYPITPTISSDIKNILPINKNYWSNSKSFLKQYWLLNEIKVKSFSKNLILKISKKKIYKLKKIFEGKI